MIAATGTSVAITSAEGVKNSMPPRAHLRQHVGVAAELVVREDLDLDAARCVSFAIASAASCARTFSGWVTGRLLPYLNENSRGARDARQAARCRRRGGRRSVRRALRRVTIGHGSSPLVLMMRFDASLLELQLTIE